jgi:peroxiredoxin Q/BCP
MARKPAKSAKKAKKKPAKSKAKAAKKKSPAKSKAKKLTPKAKKAPAKSKAKAKAKPTVKAKAKKPVRKAAKPAPKAKAAPKAAPKVKKVTIAAGMDAPDFNRPTDGGGSVSLHGLKGKAVVLYFYPRDDTPGCTVEACAFRDNLPNFSRVNATVIGVSTDGVKSHDNFKTKYSLPFPLIADEDHSLAEKYGVWVEKKNYGKTYMGMERATFLIDARGKIVQVWRNVKVDGHAEEVLDAAMGR